MKQKKLNVVLSTIILILLTLPLSSSVTDKKTCLVITDIHFTPFISAEAVQLLDKTPAKEWDTVFAKYPSVKVAEYGKESSPSLLKSLTKGLKPYVKESEFIMFGGDILCHDFIETYQKLSGTKDQKKSEAFILKTIDYFVSHLSEEFPGKSIYFTLGNNDSFSGDYALKDKGRFLKLTAPVFFDKWIRNPKTRAVFMKDYKPHGYYSIRSAENPGLRIMNINTVYFSDNYPEQDGPHPGDVELDWIERELERAKISDEKVWVVMHIPPGINVYSSEKGSSNGELNIKLMWKKKFNNRYLEIVRKYSDQIALFFTGHTHMDDIRIIYKKKKPVDYVHIAPAVSPVFGNNPAFQSIAYSNSTKEPYNYTTNYLNLKDKTPAWKVEYRFSDVYQTSVSAENLSKIYKNMKEGSPYLKTYLKYYYVQSPSSIDKSWKWYVTGIGNLTEKDFSESIKKKNLKK